MQLEDINTFAPWLVSLKYNRYTRSFTAVFHENRIVETPSFETVVKELKKHVISEIIELVSEALGVPEDKLVSRDRFQDFVDARIVTSIITHRLFDNKIKVAELATQLGYYQHSSVLRARKQDDIKEIKQKLNKVYRTFPFLESGDFEF